MDPLTHSLAALVVARAGAGRIFSPEAAPSPSYATPALLLAANVPDIDYLVLVASPTTYLEHHAATHSLAGAVLLGGALALAFWFWRRKRAEPRLLPNLMLVCLLGVLSHLLLDWSTPYGIEWGWPVKNAWYALDWFAFIDLWLLVILLLGLALPALFRLIAEEIGARRSAKGRGRGAWLALVACGLLAVGRANLHAGGVAQLEARLYRGRTPLRVAAFPVALNPFRWSGVAETRTTYEAAGLDFMGSPENLEQLSTFYKPSPSPALEAALASRTARIFLAWARFPHALITPWGDGWRVRIEDIRQAAAAPHPGALVVSIEVNRELAVAAEDILFGRLQAEPP